jgi:hypothetical protein
LGSSINYVGILWWGWRGRRGSKCP